MINAARVGRFLDTIEVSVWQAKISSDSRHDQHYWHVLDKHELAQASRLKQPLLQHRYVEIHGRLRILLGQWLNESPEQIVISRTEQGKPYLEHYPELSFNLSHAGNHVLFAIANQVQLGVDIEVIKQRVNIAGLVNKCFAKEEQGYWNQLPESHQTRAFYDFWTKKEAFVKATGHGISLGLNACVINPLHPSTFLSVPEACGRVTDWHSLSLDCDVDLSAAIVADRSFTIIKGLGF